MKDIKNLITMAYLHGENNNQIEINKINKQIQTLLKENPLITVKESQKLVKIPYGNDGEYIIPIFSSEEEKKDLNTLN